MTAGVSGVVTVSLGMVLTESALAGGLQLEASRSSGGEEGETSAIWVAKQESALIACLTSWEAPDAQSKSSKVWLNLQENIRPDDQMGIYQHGELPAEYNSGEDDARG